MKYLITGGCGFIGSNLAERVLKQNEELIIFDNLSRNGCFANLNWLKQLGNFIFIDGDIRSDYDIVRAIKSTKPDVIFHMAGQVAMTCSIDNPRLDFDINARGSLNVLEAVREHSPQTVVIYSSTNKVYGDLDNIQYQEQEYRYISPNFPEGFDENFPLNFATPYGCSKGTADQYMLDYAKIFNLKTIVFRHSSVFGERQFSTYDQGWIGWFVQQALETTNNPQKNPFTISGNGKQVRDVLFVSDLVNCYFSAIEHATTCVGKAFNLGGGMANSLSLLELFNFLEQELKIKLRYQQLPWRQSDQKIFVANINRTKKVLNWEPKISKTEGVRKIINWVKQYV